MIEETPALCSKSLCGKTWKTCHVNVHPPTKFYRLQALAGAMVIQH